MRRRSSPAPLADFHQDGAALSRVAAGHGVAARSALDGDERRRPAQSVAGGRGAGYANSERLQAGSAGLIRAQTRSQDERLTLTVREAARMLGIGHDLAYQCVKDGTIPAVMLGRRIVIPRGRFERWLDSTAGTDIDRLAGRRAS